MRTAKSRVIIRHIIVLSLLIFLALAAPRYWHGTKAESATTTAGLPTLRGEAALTHLKEQGLYASLGEAAKAARHSAQLLPPDIAPLLAQTAQLTAGDGAAEDYFGAAVAISGDTAIVGAPRNDIGRMPIKALHMFSCGRAGPGRSRISSRPRPVRWVTSSAVRWPSAATP